MDYIVLVFCGVSAISCLIGIIVPIEAPYLPDLIDNITS